MAQFFRHEEIFKTVLREKPVSEKAGFSGFGIQFGAGHFLGGIDELLHGLAAREVIGANQGENPSEENQQSDEKRQERRLPPGCFPVEPGGDGFLFVVKEKLLQIGRQRNAVDPFQSPRIQFQLLLQFFFEGFSFGCEF